jgi:hypothetical protein
MQIAEQRAEQRKRGNPNWLPGVSGNPAGRSKAARQARLDALVAEWSEPFGGVVRLSPAERLLAYQAAALALRRPARVEDAVRVTNAISKIFAQIGFADKRRRREPEESGKLARLLRGNGA